MFLFTFILFLLIFILIILYINESKKQLKGVEKSDYERKLMKWWAQRRLHYNIGLLLAGIVAFSAYMILGSILIAPYDNNFEVTLFTIIFQGAGYLFMMLIANIFYNMGYFVDKKFNKSNREGFRRKIYNAGFLFSVLLPFTIPVIIIVEYFIRFA